MERREFLKKAGLGAACMAAASVGGPYVIASPKFQWKMVTSWPPKMPILQDGAERLAKKIEEMSEGRIKIQVYAGGELVPALEVFNAVSQGTVESATVLPTIGRARILVFNGSLRFPSD